MPTSAPNPPRVQPYLDVRGMTAGYGGDPVIADVWVTVGKGEIVAIIGPNGAGKSTLLKALAGLLPAISGTVMLGDEDVTTLPTFRLARRGIGYVPQVDDVFDTLTVAENLIMGGYSLPRGMLAERVEEVATAFPAVRQLLPRTARKLSGGERKMVAVGRALMLRPQVLLLDEPTANLSPSLASNLLTKHVRALAASGVAVLVVEQRAVAALNASDWAYVMASGRVQLSAPGPQLAARDDIGELFLGAAPAPLLEVRTTPDGPGQPGIDSQRES